MSAGGRRVVTTVVVLPTYNEIENLEPFLRTVRREAPEVCVLVVDDDSPDGTGLLADRLADEIGNIEVLHRFAKQGLGSAYREGFERVLERRALQNGSRDADVPALDVIVSMDADFSHDPAAIGQLVAALDAGPVPADLVIGSRYVPGGRVVHWPAHRRLLSRWGNRYTSWALRLDVADCTSGFRAYRADALRAVDPSGTTAEGYAFLTELVRRLSAAGGTVVEVPITFVDRRYGSSKMSWRIIVESMVLVSRWGFADRWRRLRSAMGSRSTRGDQR
jgi:dolichol-phosphate mannosyltransferase